MATSRRYAAFAALWAALRSQRGGGPSLARRAWVLPAMLRDTVLRRWDGLGLGRLLMVVLGVAYVLSPIDLVPEATWLLLGLSDDLVVMGWLAGTFLESTDRYLAWRGFTPTAGGQDSADEHSEAATAIVPTHVVSRR